MTQTCVSEGHDGHFGAVYSPRVKVIVYISCIDTYHCIRSSQQQQKFVLAIMQSDTEYCFSHNVTLSGMQIGLINLVYIRH